MKGALIHGILLAVMLVYGYRTWTRDKTVQPNVGSVVLWDKAEADVQSIEYRGLKKIVKLERRPEGYWWGTDTTIEVKAKPKAPDAAGSAAGSNAGSGSAGSAAGSGSAGSGSGAGSGSAAKEPEIVTVEEEETNRKTREFPTGDSADKLIKAFASARALRDLGKPSDAAKKDYKLGTKPTSSVTLKDGTTVTTSQITVTFKDGSKRTFTVGGSVYGGSDKYVMDDKTGKAYVFSKDMLSPLEIGESNLHLIDPRGFDAASIGSVTIDANGKTKTVSRITTKGGADGNQQVKTWGDAATGKADQTAANFVDNANNLRPTEYAANIKPADLQLVLKLTYKEDKGALLGALTLYKREKPGELAPGQELDPANPPKGQTEYYIVTEKTRVPALVRKETAQRMEQDIDTVFSGKAPEPKSAVEPHGNPFGTGPLPPVAPGGGSAAGSAANPHAMPAPTPPGAIPTPPGMAPKAAPATPGPTRAPATPPTGGTGPGPSHTNPSATPSGSSAAKPATPGPTKAPAPTAAAGSASAKPPAPVPAQ
jgi:hypothetical protein